MGTPTPTLDEYEIQSVKPLQSTDGSKSGWVSVHYVRKNKQLSTKGCVSTTSSKYK